ncbi:MAG: cytochrome c maturation protein CcmE [Anaerolineales bacterium]|nr:cytochrome c maturation protein CcmE [Anaerolineales bacterium]
MQRIKFILCGLIILVAVIYLIASSTQASVEYFMTVDELKARATNLLGKNLRVSGAVIGDTIQYDPQTLSLSFDIAHVSGDNKEIEDQGGLAEVLHQAVSDKSRARIKVIYVGPKPDLLRDEAQAVMTGHLGDDGIFYANELLLKCPTRYEEAIPEQAAN